MRDQNKSSSTSEGLLSLKIPTSVKTSTTPISSSSQLPPGSSGKESSGGRKISFSLSQEAAFRLQSLSSKPDGLALLGVLSASVPDQRMHNIPPTSNCSQAVLPVTTATISSSLTISSKSSKSVSSGLKISLNERTKSDPHLVNGDNMATVQRLLSTLAAQQRVDITPTTSSSPSQLAVNTCTVRSRTGEDSSSLPPNVVASTSQPVPVPSASLSSHASSASLFPFSSMTKVALTMKTSTSQSTSTVTSPGLASSGTAENARNQANPDNDIIALVSASRSSTGHNSPSPVGSAIVGKARNVSMTSPLLINLLQTNEHPIASTGHDLKAPTSTTPKRSRKKKLDADVSAAPPVSLAPLLVAGKHSSRPKKKKKLEEGLNGISASNLATLQPALTTAQLLIQAGSVSSSGENIVLANLSQNGSQPTTAVTSSQNSATASDPGLSVSLQPAITLAQLPSRLAQPAVTCNLMVSEEPNLPGPLDSTPSSDGVSAVSHTTVMNSQEPLDEGTDLMSVCNGEYSLSSGNELASNLTEELADEDLLAILEDGSSEHTAETSLFSQSVSSDYISLTLQVDPIGTNTVIASKTNGTEPADSHHTPVVLLSSDPHEENLLESSTDAKAPDVADVGTFKQPFVPKVSYTATMAVVSLSSSSSSSKMNSSLVTSSSGASSAVRLEVASDNTGL